MYDLIDALDQDDVVINSCATEGNNTVLQGVYHTVVRNNAKNHIITSNVEHPSVLNTCKFLETLGVQVTYLPVNKEGIVTAEQVANAIIDRTALVSIMWANNETGAVFPVEAIAQAAKARGVLFHTDATQVIGKLPVSVRDRSIDFLTLSGHKFHAPKGVGALFVKAGVRLPPLLFGGEQMGGLRGGTHDVHNMIGLGMAALLAKKGITDEQTRIRALRDKLESTVLREISDTGVNGGTQHRTPNTANIWFKGVEGEAVLWDLNEHGIAASTGSACASGNEKASYVLLALGIGPEIAHSSIRFSLSRYTTEAEIDTALETIRTVIERLRNISFTYKKG